MSQNRLAHIESVLSFYQNRMLAKLTAISFVLSILAVSAGAQQSQPCKKTLSEAPAVYGLRLGMSFDEVRPVLGAKVKPPKTGEGSFFLDFNEVAPPDNLKGIRVAYLRFFAGNLYQIEFFYDDKDNPTKLDEFTGQLSTDLNLSGVPWQVKNGLAQIDCGDFVLTADTVLNRHLELTDDAAQAEFKKKKKKSKN